VNFAAGIQNDILGANDILDVWRGKMAEHIAAQEIIAANFSVRTKRNFWVREAKSSNAEVDFVFQYENLVLPLEVKSGKSGHLRSLHQFIEIAPHNLAIKTSSAPFAVEEAETPKGKPFRLLHVPFYLLSKLPFIINKYI